MKTAADTARRKISEFCGEDYIFGCGCFDRIGEHFAVLGRRAAVIVSGFGREWGSRLHARLRTSFEAAGVEILGELIPAAAENSPFEDVMRITDEIRRRDPDFVVAVGGGSNLDAAKAANVHAVFGDMCGMYDYFGVGKISELIEKTGRKLRPFAAAELASASGSHLTKYSNITDLTVGQKMLIIDDAITPTRAIFDYNLTVTMPRDFTLDGAFDGLAHCLEVWMGIPDAAKVRDVALAGIDLIVSNIEKLTENPSDSHLREMLGLGTDCGAISIMTGGTNGAHLSSFSLVDVMPHGRACALLEPYFVVFFAPVIEDRLRPVAEIYRRAGFLKENPDVLAGVELGLAVAEAMVCQSKKLGFVTKFSDVPKFGELHIKRILSAAKKPALASKLQNMPLPMSADMVDEYLGAVLKAAQTGDFSIIKHVE
ncbi:MAG TPA: iron-containing alcohol dehydrogenase [Phycisphaerae bacterium]|nr:iron-containing alcohol dehydrogenase [Phycisphaerae bacterium]HPS52555.1 iron-containing alcohol dehydrogenase [Phycisphaerae bacterium]